MSQETVVPQAVTDKEKEDPFSQIKVGMDVIDRLGQKVGKVDDLNGGAGDLHSVAAAAASVVAPQPAITVPLIQPVASADHVPQVDMPSPSEDMPRELWQRLVHDGFIRIDAGFLHHHRYALRGQIDRVDGDRVSLTVVADDLIKY